MSTRSNPPVLVQVLTDLLQRLLEKSSLLSEMADNTIDQHERRRLRGKAEGVNLAVSFVREAIRTAQSGENGAVKQ